MMNLQDNVPSPRKQQRAFAMQYGLFVGLMWLASFVLTVLGLSVPLVGDLGLLVGLFSLYYAMRYTRSFLTDITEQPLSMYRTYWFTASIFFYASLLMAVGQFVYFAYLDGGRFVSAYFQMLDMPEVKQQLAATFSTEDLTEVRTILTQLSPLDFVINILSMNLLMGLIVSLPLSLWARSKGKKFQSK